VVLEEVDVLGHLVDLPLDLLELRLQALEVALEVQDLLRTLLLLVLTAALSLLEHRINANYIALRQDRGEYISREGIFCRWRRRWGWRGWGGWDERGMEGGEGKGGRTIRL
jgi:hypothetical protein